MRTIAKKAKVEAAVVYKRSLLILLGLPTLSILCLGTMPPPFHIQCRYLDRLTALAISDASKSAATIETLTKISLRLEVKSPDPEALIGAPHGELQKDAYKDSYVREHALRNIGRIGGTEAIAFLEKLTPAVFEPDPSRRLWPAAQVALREARLNRITSAYERAEFLENAIRQRSPDRSGSAVVSWAIDELCNAGSAGSRALIRQAITKTYSNPRDSENEIRFCDGRMEAISSTPDRVKALASALTISGGEERVTAWAIYQLDAMQSPEADAQLDRYAEQIARIPDGSPARQRLGLFSEVISYLRSNRRLRVPGPVRKR